MSNNNFSTVSIMFEEIKQIFNRIENNRSNTCDLTDITDKINQSQELLKDKLKQVEYY